MADFGSSIGTTDRDSLALRRAWRCSRKKGVTEGAAAWCLPGSRVICRHLRPLGSPGEFLRNCAFQ